MKKNTIKRILTTLTSLALVVALLAGSAMPVEAAKKSSKGKATVTPQQVSWADIVNMRFDLSKPLQLPHTVMNDDSLNTVTGTHNNSRGSNIYFAGNNGKNHELYHFSSEFDEYYSNHMFEYTKVWDIEEGEKVFKDVDVEENVEEHITWGTDNEGKPAVLYTARYFSDANNKPFSSNYIDYRVRHVHLSGEWDYAPSLFEKATEHRECMIIDSNGNIRVLYKIDFQPIDGHSYKITDTYIEYDANQNVEKQNFVEYIRQENPNWVFDTSDIYKSMDTEYIDTYLTQETTESSGNINLDTYQNFSWWGLNCLVIDPS